MSTNAPETIPPTAGKKVFKSKYKDIVVKAGEDIYYLNRFKLALNSGYFEKLFLSPEWNDQNAEPINVPLDSQTFSSLVDVIYDSKWSEVLNVNNYVSVLKAKTFLEIVRDRYESLSHVILDLLKNTPTPDVKVIELMKFAVENDTLDKKSLDEIYKYVAKNLKQFQDHEEFLALPVDYFVKIIAYEPEREFVFEDRYDDQPFHEDPDLVVEVCCKWICHDLENRIPFIVTVSNAALEGLGNRKKGNDPGIKIDLSDIDEQAKHEVVLRYFKRLLDYGTLLDPGVPENPKEQRERKKMFHESYFYRSYTDERVTREDKLNEYVNNEDFYDITVKVQAKTYKLHRSILESTSGYFEELFSTEYTQAASQCDNIPSLPNKDQEYVIEGIDEATFDFVLNHIYFGATPSKDECNQVFKAARILKIDKLLDACKMHMKHNIDKFDSAGILDKLDLLQGIDRFEDLYLIYLKKHVTNSWPNLSHKAGFHSIPWTQLEKWLSSSDFYFDDAEKLLDLCSAWIMHDVKNRYHLIPQVALAIKRYGLPDYQDYKMETPTDLGSISENSIRTKLWEISSSLSLLPTGTESRTNVRKFHDWPVFVTTSEPGLLDILNVNFDRLAAMNFRKLYWVRFLRSCDSISASTIEDNLFIMGKISEDDFFLAYNIPSKKFIELNTDSRSNSELLNCRNELYRGSSEDGSLLKYSFELNRWSRFSNPEVDMNKDSSELDHWSRYSRLESNKVFFTSDGDKIYRLYSVPGTETDPTPGTNVEWFDFTQNEWISLPSFHLPSPSNRSFDTQPNKIIQFTIINHVNPAVLLKSKVLWYDPNSQQWNQFNLPDGGYIHGGRRCSVIAQGKDGIVLVCKRKLYHYSNSKQSWEFKKEMKKRDRYSLSDDPDVVAVNRPRIRLNRQ